LVFSTPENAPTEISLGLKKIWEKKSEKPPQKKSTCTAFCAGPLAPKKRVGVEQEKVVQVILASAYYSLAPPTHLPTKHHNMPGPAHSLSPIGFCWVYF
jgi:hypothetical protein